jgi:hypothetical protein
MRRVPVRRRIVPASPTPALEAHLMSKYVAFPLLLLAMTACKKSSRTIVEPQVLSCASTVPTGRLTQPVQGGAVVYTTSAGWKITMDTIEVRIVPMGSISYYVLSGSVHEYLSGKHIKDLLQTRRSLELPGGTLVTIAESAISSIPGADRTDLVNWISIYDGTESHRIAFNQRKPSVVRSCALARFEEELEHDGETGRLSETQGGLRFENIYNQGVSSSGVPLSKVFELIPLGQTDYARPSFVADYYDDPRLNAT